MKSLTLKAKLWVLCGSLLAILVIVGGIGYKSALTTEKLVDTAKFNTNKQQIASAIQFAVEREKVGARDALLHGDTKNLMDARADVQAQLDTLQPLLTSTTSHHLFEQIQSAHVNYGKFVDETIRLHQAGNDAKALDIFYGDGAQGVRAELKQTTTELVAWYSKLAADAEADEVSASKSASLWILVISCIGIVIGISLAMVLIRSLIGSVAAMVAVLQEIANHNLCVDDVQVNTEDEIGKAGRALNAMKANLSRLVNAITKSAEQLAGATHEIALAANQLSVSAHAEADQAGQAAAAMQEMSATVREVAGHAQNASNASGRAADAARMGGKVSDETLVTMNSVATSTSHAAARVMELGKSSERIGNIVEVITEIAGQTNLLALNAAIEAARAGEQGRGFAVVAGEVRRLAERTAAATQEIASMIQTIQSETKLAVEAIEKGNKEVELGVQKTGEAGSALVEIIRMSGEVGSMVAQIATAASQQEGATEQISSSVSQISQLTQEAYANADQTASACTHLTELASEMHRLVNEFSVGDGCAKQNNGRLSSLGGARP
jgi:methyl-accepting chemotaxis protein